jgi:hypothetical protein
MRYKTNQSIYSRPSTYGGTKDSYMRAFLLTNELSRLEYEKKMAAIKISALEKRMEEVRGEIREINSTIGITKDAYGDSSRLKPRKRYVTMEY